MAKERKAKIISITGMQDNTVQKLSTVALRSSDFDIHSHRYYLVNRSSQLFLIDSIYIHLWNRNAELLTQQIEELTSYYVHDASTDIVGKEYSFRF